MKPCWLPMAHFHSTDFNDFIVLTEASCLKSSHEKNMRAERNDTSASRGALNENLSIKDNASVIECECSGKRKSRK